MLILWFWKFWILTLSMAWPKVQSKKQENLTVYKPELWPKPRSAKLGKYFVTIEPEFYRLNLNGCPQATRSLLKTMSELAFSHLLTGCGDVDYEIGKRQVVIEIDVTYPDMTLTWGTSEKYRLNVMDQNETKLPVFITADTIYGARHALETFTQLTTTVITNNNKCRISVISFADIQDEPVYKHRGLLLDTARHFFSVAAITRTLDGMAASKMNVFHWHITDSQSFPLESVSLPELSSTGAFKASQIYTREKIEEIVRLAQIRGIRVVLEVDGPAHVYAGWERRQDRDGVTVMFCHNNVGQLNPANPRVYEDLRLLYRDIVDYLPKPILFHMGGDEVDINCWEMNEILTNYMTKYGFVRNEEGYYQIWAGFHNKVLGIWDHEYIQGGGRVKQPVMLWSSELTNPRHIRKYLDPDRFIIELWDREGDAHELLGMGYRLVSASEAWYLDHGLWGDTKYSTWENIYAHILPLHSNMMGGEVAMWTEVVDELTLDKRIWPRAAAFAERMWSDPASNRYAETKSRLSRHRDRLIDRGLQPETLRP